MVNQGVRRERQITNSVDHNTIVHLQHSPNLFRLVLTTTKISIRKAVTSTLKRITPPLQSKRIPTTSSQSQRACSQYPVSTYVALAYYSTVEHSGADLLSHSNEARPALRLLTPLRHSLLGLHPPPHTSTPRYTLFRQECPNLQPSKLPPTFQARKGTQTVYSSSSMEAEPTA
jgi:hypothetical protein